MVKYYRIIAHTPYCGETGYFYIATEFEDELMRFASDCVDENANEWYDDQAAEEYPDWDDYLVECHCHIEEITLEEFNDEAC